MEIMVLFLKWDGAQPSRLNLCQGAALAASMAEPQRARCVDLTLRRAIAGRRVARASRPAAALCMMDCACSWSDQSQNHSRSKRLRCAHLMSWLALPCRRVGCPDQDRAAAWAPASACPFGRRACRLDPAGLPCRFHEASD